MTTIRFDSVWSVWVSMHLMCVCVICLLVGSVCVMTHDPDIESIRSVSVECVFSCVCVCVCVSV